MESVVDQALGKVHRLYAFSSLQLIAKNYFVHAGRGVGQIVHAFQSLANVVGVEHGVFSGLAQSVRTVGENVSQGTDKHSEIAVESAHPADRLRPVIFEAQSAVGLGDGYRRGQEGFELLFHGNGTGPGPAATVRSREGLVQIQVHHVDTEVAGTDFANQGIHVGAVHVKQAALGMHDLGNLVDLLLEHSQRVGIGQHERSDFIIHLRGQCSHIHHALGIRFQVLHRIADHRGRRGIGAVRGIRDQNFLARIAFRLMIGADHQQSCELAVRSSSGLQGDGVHAGNFDETLA